MYYLKYSFRVVSWKTDCTPHRKVGKKNKYLSVSENHVETSENDNNNSFFFTSKPDTDKNKEQLLESNIWKFEKSSPSSIVIFRTSFIVVFVHSLQFPPEAQLKLF
jgi:hypothetical protein